MEFLDGEKLKEDFDYTISDDEGNWFDNSLRTIELIVLPTAAVLFIIFVVVILPQRDHLVFIHVESNQSGGGLSFANLYDPINSQYPIL